MDVGEGLFQKYTFDFNPLWVWVLQTSIIKFVPIDQKVPVWQACSCHDTWYFSSCLLWISTWKIQVGGFEKNFLNRFPKQYYPRELSLDKVCRVITGAHQKYCLPSGPENQVNCAKGENKRRILLYLMLNLFFLALIAVPLFVYLSPFSWLFLSLYFIRMTLPFCSISFFQSISPSPSPGGRCTTPPPPVECMYALYSKKNKANPYLNILDIATLFVADAPLKIFFK